MREDLDTLDEAAWGAASEVKPKFVSRSDPAAQWTGALKGHACFAYATNDLIDLDHAVIVDVETTRAIRQAEVGSARTMIERTQERFGLWPARLAADSAYGSADNLAWLVHERGIEPHIPVIDKAERTDGVFSRSDFAYDHQRDLYTCPAGKDLHRYRRPLSVQPQAWLQRRLFQRYRPRADVGVLPRTGHSARGRGSRPSRWWSLVGCVADLGSVQAAAQLPHRGHGRSDGLRRDRRSSPPLRDSAVTYSARAAVRKCA